MKILARTLALTLALSALAGVALAQEATPPAPDWRWGVSIWGVSYHINRSIDYDETNLGLGVRYLFNQYFFAEVDALRDSNRGLVLPVSAGAEVRFASIGPCRVAAVAAVTVAYYQNLRTESDYYKIGPVPGASVTCGRAKTNVVVILSPSHDPIAALAASLTILF